MISELQPLLGFYEMQRRTPPAIYAYAAKTMPTPIQFFSVEKVQAMLNNPLLTHDWVSLIQRGAIVPLDGQMLWKTVLRKRLLFMDKAAMNAAIAEGAAVLVEGLDILDPDINQFVARLDELMPCALSNAVAFFSQHGNEAYKGHRDTDDVLVVQISGQKKWEIFEPQQRRYLESNDLSRAEMGTLAATVTMNPGDALYVRAGVPHICQTSGAHSLHLSFDLCDRTPNIEQISNEANQRYNKSAANPYQPAATVTARYVDLLQSAAFQSALSVATTTTRQEATRFRSRIANASGINALKKYI